MQRFIYRFIYSFQNYLPKTAEIYDHFDAYKTIKPN